jgi:arsenate reductase
MKRKILFICVHNSARSQMAAALANRLCGDEFEAESAGREPGSLNPFVVRVLAEEGIDISNNETRAVFAIWKSGKLFDHIVTVCSEAESEGCPIFPETGKRLHWPFDDPSKFIGTEAGRLEQTRRLRDQIRVRVESFCHELKWHQAS